MSCLLSPYMPLYIFMYIFHRICKQQQQQQNPSPSTHECISIFRCFTPAQVVLSPNTPIRHRSAFRFSFVYMYVHRRLVMCFACVCILYRISNFLNGIKNVLQLSFSPFDFLFRSVENRNITVLCWMGNTTNAMSIKYL